MLYFDKGQKGMKILTELQGHFDDFPQALEDDGSLQAVR